MKTLILDSTVKSIKIALQSSITTTNPTFNTAYADNSDSGFAEASTDGALNGTSDVTVISAPGTGIRRVIKQLTIYNADTQPCTLLVKYDNNGSQRILAKVTLQVGDTWTNDGTFDANGSLKQTVSNVNLATQVLGILGIANGGTGASIAADARANLGLTIGSNIQAWDADLDAIAALAGAAGFLKKTALNTWALDTNSYLTGNQSISITGDATGSGSTAISLTLANSGVVAGTYTKVTVDAKGRVTSATTLLDTDIPNHDASKLTSGTLTAARLPAFTGDATSSAGTSALTLANSGVVAGTYTKVTVDAKGRVTSATTLLDTDIPNHDASKLTSGTLTAARLPAFTGDATSSAGTSALTLANSGVSAGTYNNSSTAITPITVDAKGRITSTGAAVTITPTWASITSKPTTISGFGISDAYTKNEVDGFLQGLNPKATVKAATTVNITLSGTQTIDGVALNVGDRVLVKDQSTQAQNGIYVVASSSWSRATDINVWAEVPGAFVFVEQGSTNADFGFVCTSNSGGTLDSTAITWVQFNGAANVVNGTGLSKSGNTLSITNTGVSATSYGSASQVATFTVNAQGQLTSASNTSISISSGQVSGLASSATTDTTNATNITSGTLPVGRLPALTGDVTRTAGTSTLTLSNSGVSAGTYTKVTVDAKGRVTSATTLSSADLPTYTGSITSSQVTTALGYTPFSSAGGTVTGNGVIARAAANQDGIELRGRAGGSSNFEVILTPATLTADRTFTFPDSSGTIMTTAQGVTTGKAIAMAIVFGG